VSGIALSNEERRALVETGLGILRRGKRSRLQPGVVLQLVRQERQRQRDKATPTEGEA
jgi:hypothetical protein